MATNPIPVMRDHRGFTLLEMLLAIAIFSVISLMGWQMFNGIIQARDLVTSRNQATQELNHALTIIDRDFRQLADRGTRVENEVNPNSLFSDSEMRDTDDEAIALVRYGWQNTGQRLPRSTMQRVFYRLKEGRLERQFHYVLDPVNINQEPQTQTLLTDVERLEFRFFANGQWHDDLPTGQFPEGIAIEFERQSIGTIERRYLLSSPWPDES